ncbi:MAG: glycosyltransferase family 4 protein [archaeon]
MKIFYITSVLSDIGGSEIYTRDLLKELINRGHELFVFTTAKYDLPGAKVYSIPVFGHSAFHKFEAPLFYWKAIREAKKFNPDLIQSHSNSCMGLIGHVVKRNLKKPHVMLIELISSMNQNLHTKTIFQTEKFLLPKLNYNKLVVWTENMKKKFLLPWGVEEGKIEVIPAAVNVKNYDLGANGSEINKKYGEKLITSIKSLWGTNATGIEYIIKAMKIVSRKYPEYKYIIFGWGKERERLERMVKELALEENVQFAGAIHPNECANVAAATTVAPHSFVYEFSTSISLLEYMAWGKACVVTDIGSVREFVGDSALVVKAKDEKAMAEGIIKLIEDNELRESLERKARKRVEEKYSIKATVDRLEGIYEGLIKNN